MKDSSEVVASVAAPAMTFFQTPVKAIKSQEDLKKFESSTSYRELMQFIQLSSEAIVGFEMPAISATITSSSSATFPSPSPSSSSCCNTAITEITSFFSKIASWVDEIPPIQQPMRFGNKAFRDWHARLVQEAPFFLAQYLQEHTPDRNSQATCELEYYLCTSFGNETRIDYGTGHETNFLVFLFCLAKLDVLKGGDLKDMITHIFRGYIQVMRKLQQIYMLEPAGTIYITILLHLLLLHIITIIVIYYYCYYHYYCVIILSLTSSLLLLLLLLSLLLLILVSLILLIFDRNLFNTTLKLEQDLMVFGDWMIIIAWSLYLGQLSL